MELKTDKIEQAIQAGILNTKPTDWEEAQAQLKGLCDELASARAERDQFKGICERFKREIEDLGHTCWTCGRPVHPNRVREWRMTGAAPCHHGEVPPCERCGRQREQAAVDVGDRLCAACADRVVKEATDEHLVATSPDGGKSWWCPKCQASIVPDVPHACPGLTCRRCGSYLLDGRDHGVGACPGDGMP